MGADVKAYFAFVISMILLTAVVAFAVQQSYSSSGLFKLSINGIGSAKMMVRGNAALLLGEINDSDNDSLVDIPTEMLSLQLVGSSNLGTITVRLNNATPSKGMVEAKKNKTSRANLNKTNQTYPAHSFFDVFVEIDISGKNATNQTNATNGTGHGLGISGNNATNQTNATNGTGHGSSRGHRGDNSNHGNRNHGNPRAIQEVPAMTLFNKEPIKIRANAVINGNKTSVHGLYRSLTGEVDLFDKNNPNGPPVGKLKLHFLQLIKPFR